MKRFEAQEAWLPAALQSRYASAIQRFESREDRFSSRVLMRFAASGAEGFAVKAQADGITEVLLYDEIGYWGVTAKDFVMALASIGPGPLRLRINSPGGDVFDGLAIYNALRARVEQVTIVIDGIAASAASVVAMAGKTLEMPEHAMLMIHNCWGVCIGNRNDMIDMASVQEKIDGQMAEVYAAKSGKPAAQMAAAMDAETYYTSTEAKEIGLCDTILNQVDAQMAISAAVSLKFSKVKTNIHAAEPEWTSQADEDLPIDTEASWDGSAAAERMLDAAGFNGDSPDTAKAKRGFLAYDNANPKVKGSYKLPFADIVGGELKALKSGLDAAASRLPQSDLPDDVKTKARSVIDVYERKMGGAENAEASAKARIEHRRRKARLAAAEAA